MPSSFGREFRTRLSNWLIFYTKFQEVPHLEVFINIQFDSKGKPKTNIENIRHFSCAYTLALIVNTFNENKINHYLLMKKNGKVKSVVNSIAVNVWSLPQGVGSMLAHWLKCIGRKLRRFLVCHRKFLDMLKLSHTRSTSGINLIFPFTFL